MASKKRNRGKRHKNMKSGNYHTSVGTSKRNRNWKQCTHFDCQTGKQCTVRVFTAKGNRALCDYHVRRHRKGSKTRSTIDDYQGNKFHGSMRGAP